MRGRKESDWRGVGGEGRGVGKVRGVMGGREMKGGRREEGKGLAG